jgi:uncharacterized membrane protein
MIPVALACAAIATPWLVFHSPALGLALERGFSLVCHQQAERSFFLFGGTVAVCARCLGIYLGAAVGMLFRVSRQLAWRLLMTAAAINLIDWLAEFSGLHGNWMPARFALGLTLGAAAAMLVGANAEEAKVSYSAKVA